jgi:hypothetical protein
LERHVRIKMKTDYVTDLLLDFRTRLREGILDDGENLGPVGWNVFHPGREIEPVSLNDVLSRLSESVMGCGI